MKLTVRSALLYGAETWALTSRLMDAEVYGRSDKSGSLAVRWQRCVGLKTFLLS